MALNPAWYPYIAVALVALALSLAPKTRMLGAILPLIGGMLWTAYKIGALQWPIRTDAVAMFLGWSPIFFFMTGMATGVGFLLGFGLWSLATFARRKK